MSSIQVAAIILSAGTSARMGAFKPLLQLKNRTILEHVLETVQAAGVEEIRVVVGHRAEDLVPAVEAAGAAAVYNPHYETGMFSSVCAGVSRLDAAVDAFFLLPVDIPLVRPATFRRLAAAWTKHPGHVFYPVFAGKRGHPPLVPTALIPAILKSPGDGGLRKVLEGYEDLALEVAVADENILFDLDLPEDYEAARRRYPRLEDPSRVECEEIISRIHPLGEAAVRHGRQVQQVAAALCRALNRSGANLDERRAAAAALLHDIAKGATDHAAKGGRMLEDLGFARVAAIVAAHTDLPEGEVRRPTEAAVVYLADKLVSKNRFVSLQSRFDAAKKRFGGDPAARAAIDRRRNATLSVKQMVEEKAGLSLDRILSEAGIRCEEGSRP